MPLMLNDSVIATDKDGFLENPEDWTPDLVVPIARQENISLSEEHRAVILLLRAFYLQFEIVPSMRVLVKLIKEKLDPDKGQSLYLIQLFGASPLRKACKLAGLPKPSNCI